MKLADSSSWDSSVRILKAVDTITSTDLELADRSSWVSLGRLLVECILVNPFRQLLSYFDYFCFCTSNGVFLH